jgi:phage tail sheath protein FI
LKPDTYEVKGSGSLEQPRTSDLQGDEAERTGLAGLAAIDEVTMVCVPDIMVLPEAERENLQGQMIAHCEAAADRMAIIDAPPDLSSQGILQWRDAQGWTSKFAALYYPWIEVMDPVDNQRVMVPPSGHVAGVWARTDATRGVHKAPANEVVLGANGLSFQVTHAEQGEMNRQGINCIRSFPGRGIRIWGARTMSTLEDPEWRYINVRRLFNFVSESIMEGTQWAVFEPNDATLWTQLRIAATNFLTRVWRDGALFGATPGEAFYVKCDEETNPPEMVEAGQVTVEIGIAPVKPAEFVVFRISQFQVGAEATA